MHRGAEPVGGERHAREIFEFADAALESEIRDEDVVAFIIGLLADLRGDRFDRAGAGQRERRRGETSETEIDGAGGQRLDHVLVGGIGGHLDVEALGLEVALLDAEEKNSIGNAARGAHCDALLRGGGRQQGGEEREGSKGGTNHTATIANGRAIRPLGCRPHQHRVYPMSAIGLLKSAIADLR